MLLYITQSGQYTALVFENYVQQADKSSLSIVKLLCQRSLFSYESRIATTNKYLNTTTKTPIYINNSLLLIPTKSPRQYDNIWINYKAISNINSINNHTEVVFIQHKTLIINQSTKQFKSKIKICEKLCNYIENIEGDLI